MALAEAARAYAEPPHLHLVTARDRPQPNQSRRVIVALGSLKMAVAASAAAVTLAAGGLALSDVASIMASFGGVLVSVVTLAALSRRWLKERRRFPPPPVPPPGLSLDRRVTREDYAQALKAQEEYSRKLEEYYRKREGGEL